MQVLYLDQGTGQAKVMHQRIIESTKPPCYLGKAFLIVSRIVGRSGSVSGGPLPRSDSAFSLPIDDNVDLKTSIPALRRLDTHDSDPATISVSSPTSPGVPFSCIIRSPRIGLGSSPIMEGPRSRAGRYRYQDLRERASASAISACSLFLGLPVQKIVFLQCQMKA